MQIQVMLDPVQIEPKSSSDRMSRVDPTMVFTYQLERDIPDRVKLCCGRKHNGHNSTTLLFGHLYAFMNVRYLFSPTTGQQLLFDKYP